MIAVLVTMRWIWGWMLINENTDCRQHARNITYTYATLYTHEPVTMNRVTKSSIHYTQQFVFCVIAYDATYTMFELVC